MATQAQITASWNNSPQGWLEARLTAAGQTVVAPPAVTGSRAADAWRTSLMSALVTLGVAVDSSVA